MTEPRSREEARRITGVVVHWHNEAELARLVGAWPRDPRFDLIVVDNGSSEPLPAGDYKRIAPGRNLGFAGGVNAGMAATHAPAVLLLNPDARPAPGALESLLAGMAAHPRAAGLVPRLLGADGKSQHRWQLRPLPSPGRLLLETLLVAPPSGPAEEPPAGTPVEQPAAAALLLRRETLAALGGLDEGFYPAWFEDVDLAKRLADRGDTLQYWPDAVFHHGLGASVPRLGYGRFLWVYQRSQHRYLRKHHGRGWAAAIRLATVAGMLLRLALLPLRKPRRAATRRSAASGLAGAALGALTAWKRPRTLAREIPLTAARRSRETS